MQRITSDEWSFSPGINRAGRAFVQRWLETFHFLTIDNYRVRHLNVRLGFEELRHVIGEYENASIELVNIEDVAAEVLKLLKEDPIAKSVLDHHESYYPCLSHPLAEKSKTVHPGLRVLVEQACDVLKVRYRPALFELLKASIAADNVENAILLGSLVASDLVGSGYDLRHLYWRGRAFIRKPTRPFEERLASFLEPLREQSYQRYLVAYRIDFPNPSLAGEFPSLIGALRISAESEISAINPELRPYFPGPNVRLATCSAEALDPFAASRKASTELYKALDIVQFAHPAMSIRSHDTAYVVHPAGRIQPVPIPLELLGPIRIVEEEVERRISQLTSIRGRVEEISIRRLELGLQYLRRGLTESAPQGQFLNYWIGLEAIAGGKHRTEITTLRKTVPQMITLGYPRRLLRDLLENFVRQDLALDPVLGTVRTDLSGVFARVEALWRCICSLELRGQLEALASETPLLQHRIRSSTSLLGRSDSVRRSMDLHSKDIEWHIQRLYRIRNSIVHGGYVPDDLTHLASHLSTYLWVILRSVLDDFSSENGTRDIKKFFDKHLLLYEMVCQKLESLGTNDPPFSTILETTSLWPQC